MRTTKTLLTIILLFLAVASPAISATFTAVQAGNFTANTTWGTAAGAVEGVNYPGPGDNIALAAYVVAADISTMPSTGSYGTITASGVGQLTFDMTAQSYSLTATTITGGTVAGMLKLSGAPGANTFTLTATTITGGTAANATAFYNNSTVNAVINANIVGGSNTTAHGVDNYSTGTVSITGNITGGTGASAFGVNNQSTGTVSITGNITGGTAGSYCVGVYNNAAGTITLVSGDITGGTAPGAFGVRNYATTSTFNLPAGTNLIWGTREGPYSGKPPVWTPAASSYIRMGAVGDFPLGLTASSIKKDVVSGTVTGTYAPSFTFGASP